MLLSQRIVKDPKFLRKHRGHDENLFAIRQMIIEAPKVIVNTSMLDFSVTPTGMLERKGKDNSEEERDRDVDMMRHFAKLPFETMVFENETGLVLVKEIGSRCICVWTILKSGLLLPFIYAADLLGITLDKSNPKNIKFKIDFGGEIEESIKDQMTHMAMFEAMWVFEIILFLNVQNVRIHEYTPTKKENSMVPKPLQSKYIYRIIDVYREKDVFRSMREIDEFLTKDNVARRAHMVKGHWKVFGRYTENERIFWWNSHMRNRKNIATAGFVETDYRIPDQ
jgi:hypothetical protein